MIWMDQWIAKLRDAGPAAWPVSWFCDGRSSRLVRDEGDVQTSDIDGLSEHTGRRVAWTDRDTQLRVTIDLTHFSDLPACYWQVSMENVGTQQTPILENINVLDLTLTGTLTQEADTELATCDAIAPETAHCGSRHAQFVLHRTRGGRANPTDFEVMRTGIWRSTEVTMSAHGGRSSNRDLPFFRIDAGQGTAIVAVGWTGQWQARVKVDSEAAAHVTAGMEHCRFFLQPGERVKLPSIALLLHEGTDRHESNVLFRRMIRRHFAPGYRSVAPRPILTCNTCFTRNGEWLNECNESNQISLINALAPLGAEVVITDAGWFRGGWPDGAGNWDPDPQKYPNGMAPVAQAAAKHDMTYGLWFEPERVTAGTTIDREHPQWVLWPKGKRQYGLLNFALPEVREYFLNIIGDFMTLAGFAAYRQDFNIDPLPHWLDNDEPDRQGITEIRYIEGLYAFWDQLAERFPDAYRENCAGGGRRIDLECIRRFHAHQKSDYWFDNVTDQASLYALNQYLPTGICMTPLNRLDEAALHSVLPSTLSLGWIADDPDFDLQRAKSLITTYRDAASLTCADWYPLTPYSRRAHDVMAEQFHDPDANRGLVLAYRRHRCPHRVTELSLRALEPDQDYELTWQVAGTSQRVSGMELMRCLAITWPPLQADEETGQTELIWYQAAE